MVPDLAARASGRLEVSIDVAEDDARMLWAYRVELELIDGPADALPRTLTAGFEKDKRARAEHLAPGTWRVRLKDRVGVGRDTAQQTYDDQTVVVRAGETARVKLALP